jgi:hypothetical protein
VALSERIQTDQLLVSTGRSGSVPKVENDADDSKSPLAASSPVPTITRTCYMLGILNIGPEQFRQGSRVLATLIP